MIDYKLFTELTDKEQFLHEIEYCLRDTRLTDTEPSIFYLSKLNHRWYSENEIQLYCENEFFTPILVKRSLTDKEVFKINKSYIRVVDLDKPLGYYPTYIENYYYDVEGDPLLYTQKQLEKEYPIKLQTIQFTEENDLDE